MGESFTSKCSKCNYSVMTSAGLDYGMLAVVETHICKNCRNIVDVSVGERGKVYSREELDMHPEKNNPDNAYYICHMCGEEEALVRWDINKRPCPRCDGRINLDPKGDSVLWD